jgi:endogenous inhibitor of DNA gyrase (YacG/DUF329 family)
MHHIDGDPGNNDLANLMVVTPQEHGQIHKANIENARIAAATWHGSAAGRKWHSIHGKQTWVGRKSRLLKCEWCGKEFDTRDRRAETRFCSNKCRHYARNASGVDNETRLCAYCGTAFTRNRFAKAKCCSKRCAGLLRRKRTAERRAAAGLQPVNK